MEETKKDVADSTEDVAVVEGEETVIEEEPTSEVVDESLDTDGEEEALAEPGGEEAAEAVAEDGDADPDNPDILDDDPKGVKRRIDKVTREKYAALAEAKEAKRELAEIRRKEEEAAATEVAPKRADYEDYEDFVADNAAFSAKRAVREEMRVDAEKKAETERNATLEKTFAAHEDRVAAYKEKVEDFNEVAYGAHILPIMQDAPYLAQLVVESDQSPEIAYHLGSNPEVAEKIAAMPMHLAAKEIGKIEARLEKAPKPKNKSKAPTPIKPVKGKDAGAVERSAEDMSMDEYAAARKAGTIR